VLLGKVPMREPELSSEFVTLMSWADKSRRLRVRANADTPADARVAMKFGAEGIGLCRTEHMFFEADRIRAVREMILSDDEKSRRAALAKLLPMQRADFVGLFEIMKGLPVTIRLLDPPLHEFLPHTEAEIAEVAQAMAADPKKLSHRAHELYEVNPMLGFRGCRAARSIHTLGRVRRVGKIFRRAPGRLRSPRRLARDDNPLVLRTQGVAQGVAK
jgi:pyruvate,orthophosphate dikinase